MNRLFTVLGLLFNIVGASVLAFVVRVPIVPICNDERVCITSGGEILKLPIPVENPLLLRLGLVIILLGFLFQLIGIVWPTKKLGKDSAFYFAYGSNMSHEQMKDRCPSSVFLKRAYLNDYKFVYDGYSQKRNGAVANIIESSGSKVWGGIFQINPGNLVALDCCEGYPNSYNRKEFNVIDDEGNSIVAVSYFRTGKTIGNPSDKYRRIVQQGAIDCGLPEDYIRSL